VSSSRLVWTAVSCLFMAPRAYPVEPGLPSRAAVVTMAAPGHAPLRSLAVGARQRNCGGLHREITDRPAREASRSSYANVVRAGILQAKRMAELGEPWIFGVPEGSEASFLRSEGLEPRQILPSNGLEATRCYRTRRDGTLVGGVPASESSPAILVEAVVPLR
jgi:hypothetical protein